MAPGEKLPPDFVLALRVLDAAGLPYAEAWRLLRPVAARLDVPRPSYFTVRRILREQRVRKERRLEVLDSVLADLLQGRVPLRLVR